MFHDCFPHRLQIYLWGTVLVALSVTTIGVTSNRRDLSNPTHCHFNGEGTWSVGMLEGPHWSNMTVPRDRLSLPNGQQVSCPRNPIMACADITDVNASFAADPFLFFPNGTYGPWYAFFEVKNMNDDLALRARRGQIGTAVSHDQGITWTYLQIVLKADHHLSYPHVTHFEGEVYMLPQGRSMSLYKSTAFPLQWQFQRYLLKPGLRLNDITTVYFQGRWWAFGVREHMKREEWKLHIYFADRLTGPWQPTPHNCHNIDREGGISCVGEDVTEPHKSGSRGVRPGGCMFVEDGKLYRVVQDSHRLYGDNLNLYEVTSLTIDGKMAEVVVPSFRRSLRAQDNVEEWNSVRFHHADLHMLPGRAGLSDRWVMLTDGDYNRGMAVRGATFTTPRCSDMRRNHWIA